MKNVSSAVGWAISLGSVLERKEHFEDGQVKSRLPGVEPRLCTAYNTLVYCVSKVSTSSLHLCMICILNN